MKARRFLLTLTTFTLSRPLSESVSCRTFASQRALREHARIELNRGKTRIWNAGGEEPANISDLHGQSEEPIWTGDWALPRDRQGFLVLGTPLGTDEYVASTLAARRETQQRLLTRIPDVPDLQAAWLLLHFCAAPRANYLLRNAPPALTAQFAADHDAAVATCLGSLVHCGDHMAATATQASQLALGFGGLGLRSAAADAQAAYWASWLDTLPAIQARSPQIAAHLRRALAAPHASGSAAVAAAAQAATHLAAQGCHVPAWDASEPPCLAPEEAGAQPATASAAGNGTPPVPVTSARSRCISPPCPPHLGRCCSPKLGRTQPAASRSAPRMKQSPSRPQSSECYCCAACGYRSHSLLESVHAVLDPLGDHRAACANSGALASRALPLERAVARVCQEAGARVARNMRLADMNLPVPVADARRIEIVCNGLPLWHGAQLVVDTTCVSPVTRSGEPRTGADSQPGLALQLATRRKRRETYPELSRSPRCRLVVSAVETGGRWGPEPTAFLRLLAQARAASAHAAVRSALRAAYVSRWSGIIAVAARRALASSLLELPPQGSWSRCRRTGCA